MAATLAPVLPYLLPTGGNAGEAATGELSKAAADAVSEKAKALWARVRPEVEARPAAAEAAADVAAALEDEDGRIAWRRQLRNILDAKPDLAREMRGFSSRSRLPR